jgi:hypothetical protein
MEGGEVLSAGCPHKGVRTHTRTYVRTRTEQPIDPRSKPQVWTLDLIWQSYTAPHIEIYFIGISPRDTFR